LIVYNDQDKLSLDSVLQTELEIWKNEIIFSPSTILAYRILVETYISINRKDLAIETCNKFKEFLLTLNREERPTILGYQLLGYLYLELALPKLAIEAFKEVIQFMDHPLAKENLKLCDQMIENSLVKQSTKVLLTNEDRVNSDISSNKIKKSKTKRVIKEQIDEIIVTTNNLPSSEEINSKSPKIETEELKKGYLEMHEFFWSTYTCILISRGLTSEVTLKYYKSVTKINEVVVKYLLPSTDKKNALTFRVVIPHNKYVTLRASSKEEYDSWVKTINDALAKMKAKK